MANETPVTVVGNLVADPELRWTQSGVAVASFTIASTPRKFNRQTGEWEDEEAMFLRCSIWRDAAENVSESLEKGSRVIAQGNLKQRSFTDREGNQRTSIELDVQEVGPSTKYAVAKPQKVDRRQQGGGFGGGAPQGGYGQQGAPQGGGTWSQGQQAPQGAWAGQGAPQGPPAQQGAPQGQWAGQGQPQQGQASPWAGQQGGSGYDDRPPF